MVFNNSKNFYDVLGVDFEADFNTIRSAYRSLARKYHPDVNKTKDAEEIFKEITNAYNTLSDSRERERYNILKGIFKEQKETSPKDDYQKKEYKKNQTAESSNVKTESKKSLRKTNFNLFKTLKAKIASLRRFQRIKNNNKPQKGENITTDIQISPEEVLSGSQRIINVRTTKACPQCFGRKFVNEGNCSKCNGKGEIIETKKITVKIPKGVKHGAKLRLKGEGASGKNGGPCGDLYINIKIESKARVQYDKLNIYYNIPITPYEAALGDEILINTFDNEKIKFKLPKNTSSGQKFRIANQGIKKGGKVGDLIITVSIEFSKDLSEDEIKLYKELKNLSKDNIRKDTGYGS